MARLPRRKRLHLPMEPLKSSLGLPRPSAHGHGGDFGAHSIFVHPSSSMSSST